VRTGDIAGEPLLKPKVVPPRPLRKAVLDFTGRHGIDCVPVKRKRNKLSKKQGTNAFPVFYIASLAFNLIREIPQYPV
jgi:hypothetical protein